MISISSIITIEPDISFYDVEVDVMSLAELDERIAEGKVIRILEGKEEYRLSSSVIVFYKP